MKQQNIRLQNIFPFLVWIKKLQNVDILKKDILAGITVALVLVPQSMAYAGLAGLSIEVGLYTAFVPVIIAGLFGTSAQMSTGPITIVSLMTATALAPMALSENEYVVYASLLAFMTGIFYMLLGWLRMGIIVEFLSHPVILGFTNAVALLTIFSQTPKLFGIVVEKGSHFFEHMTNLVTSIISGLDIATSAVGLSSIMFLLFLARFFPKAPRVLLLLILSISGSYFFGYSAHYSGSIIESIPSSLPQFSLPFMSEFTGNLSLNEFGKLMLYSMIIGLIAFTQTISVAKFVGYRNKQKVSANKELMAQGLANVSSSFFGGYGVAGSFSKTAVNIRNGASTGFSSVVTGCIVLLTLLYLTPLLYHLPLATLAAIIIVAVMSMIKVTPIFSAWKVEKHDAFIAIFTGILTLLLSPNLERAILIGVILSLALYIYRTMRPKIGEVSLYKDGEYRDHKLFGLKTSKHISIVRVDGDLYFANANYFEDEILNVVSDKKKLKIIILDLEWMNNIDSSGLQMLENLTDRLKKMKIKIFMTNVRVRLTETFHHTGFLERFGEKHVYSSNEDVIEHIRKKLGKDIDTSMFLEYRKDKHKTPELDKKIIKKIDNF
ncbi:MAG: SulP family inorganic anion transporter [Candidatus Gracilibacteria bacterium]|nr:SulP family inorganic anion transporter [Candidatus Gracilibacteria bacterium]